MVFSAEKDSELICGLSANVHGISSNRYVGGMMFLLSSASLYAVICLIHSSSSSSSSSS